MLYGYPLPGLHPFSLFRHPWVIPQSITHARLTSHLPLHTSSPPRGDKRMIGLPRLSCPSYQGHEAQFTTSSPRRVSASPPRRKAERPHHVLLPLTAGKQSYLFGNLVGSTHYRPLAIGCMVIAPEPKPHSWKSSATLIAIAQPLINLGEPHASLMVPA